MRRTTRTLTAAVLLACGGCMSGPLVDNPVLLRPGGPTAATVEAPPGGCANPVYLPLGPDAYGLVFEHTLDVVDDFFVLERWNRYDGRIETFPRIAPGLEQPWKPGSPDFSQRLLATLQTIRHRCVAQVHPDATGAGFYIDVKVYKELEDLPRPDRSTAGPAVFRGDITIERQYDVVDPTVVSPSWIPLGRDVPLEQEILRRLELCNTPAFLCPPPDDPDALRGPVVPSQGPVPQQ